MTDRDVGRNRSAEAWPETVFRLAIGYSFACLAAGVAFTVLAMTVPCIAWNSDCMFETRHARGLAGLIGNLIVIPIVLFYGGGIIGGVTFLLTSIPSAIVILILELLALRTFSIHLVIGVMMSGVGVYIDYDSSHHARDVFEPSTLVFGAMGMVAGTVYWAIAGRHAGKWRRTRCDEQGVRYGPQDS